MENYCGHQSYDYRLKALVAYSGNPALFSDLEIPVGSKTPSGPESKVIERLENRLRINGLDPDTRIIFRIEFGLGCGSRKIGE